MSNEKKNPDLQSLSDDSLESVSGGVGRRPDIKPVQPVVMEIASVPGNADQHAQRIDASFTGAPDVAIKPVQPIQKEDK